MIVGEGGKVAQQQRYRVGGMLRDDAVAQGPELGGAGQREVGDPPGWEAHEVFDEGW
ncbi:hypothetical protein [Saccharopolyspora pogona]|uniref:hypothetical protein n=1 Tax=Saccharopolyspora pogona TaxID=333966 RepID=UPI0037CA376C